MNGLTGIRPNKMARLDQEKVDTIVIHITDSSFGDTALVRQWHKERGWADIGYHFLITNCFPTRYRFEAKRPDLASDGTIHAGRSILQRGAHVKGHNWHSIGIAMVGKRGVFTSKQLEAAIGLCANLKKQYPTITTILGHYELDDNKTCPDLDMDMFREWCCALRTETES